MIEREGSVAVETVASERDCLGAAPHRSENDLLDDAARLQLRDTLGRVTRLLQELVRVFSHQRRAPQVDWHGLPIKSRRPRNQP